MQPNQLLSNIIIYIFCITSLNAQQDSLRVKPLQLNPNLYISAYLETYYMYDFNKPNDNTRPPIFYAYTRNNEVSVNLGLIRAAYSTDDVRANLAFMAGTYANANLAAEPGVLKNIYEANIGIRLKKEKDLWLDAGVFPSHLGFESAIGMDCQTLTRSLMAESSPYYESGAKISYTSPSGKWFISGLILNGWQHIQRPDGNTSLSVGHQVTYKPNSRVTLNSSLFIGDDKQPGETKRMRYFHDLYGQFQLTPNIFLTAGFDVGLQQSNRSSVVYNSWCTPIVIATFTLNEKASLSVRGEYFDDKYGIIIKTSAPGGFKTAGGSVNFDYKVYNNVLWRIEARTLSSEYAVFEKRDLMVRSNSFVGTSLAIMF